MAHTRHATTLAWSPLTVAVAVLAILLGGCGQPKASTGDHGADTWAKSVCEALTPWRTEIAELTRRTQEHMASTTTPEQTKTNLVALLSGAEQASETARKRVVEAGAAPVPDGQRIADRFTTSLQQARDAYGHARRSIEALAPKPAPQFYDGVNTIFVKLGKEYEASAIDTSDIRSTDLQRAFDEAPECG